MDKQTIRDNGHFTLQCVNGQFQVAKNVLCDSLNNFTYYENKSSALKGFHKRTDKYLQKEIKRNNLSKYNYFERKV